MVKNPPCNAGETGLTPGEGTKILDATELLSPEATTTESMHRHERSPPNATKILGAATKI